MSLPQGSCLLNIWWGTFPAGPGVRTLRLQCRGVRVQPLVRELRSHIPQSVAISRQNCWMSDQWERLIICEVDGKWASQRGSMVKNPLPSAGEIRDTGLIPGSGRSLEVRNGNPLNYPCLENPLDRRTRLPVVHGVTKTWTRLKHLSMQANGNCRL